MKPKKLACLLQNTVLKKQLKDMIQFTFIIYPEELLLYFLQNYLILFASFGFLNCFEDFIVNHKSKSVRLISSNILRQKINFTCDLHEQKVQDVVISIVVNINLNLLKLNDIYKLELAKFMHKLYNNNLRIVF